MSTILFNSLFKVANELAHVAWSWPSHFELCVGLGGAALYALVYGVQSCLRNVKRLSALVERQEQRWCHLHKACEHRCSLMCEKMDAAGAHRAELEAIIEVQAERLAAQSKHLGNFDANLEYLSEKLESLQTQLTKHREKTDDVLVPRQRNLIAVSHFKKNCETNTRGSHDKFPYPNRKYGL